MSILESTVGATFLARAKQTPEQTAFRIWSDTENRFDSLTFGQLYHESRYVSIGLTELGIQPGDRVAVQCSARPEWLIADFAIMGAQAISVPISPSATPEELLFVLRHSHAAAIFVESERLLTSLLQMKAKEFETLGRLKAVVLVDPPTSRPADEKGDFAVITLPALRAHGTERDHGSRDRFELSLGAIKPDDLLSITYTPGTTGNPKGVMLTHRNLRSVLEDSLKTLGRFVNAERDAVYSLLDSANVLGRVELYAGLAFGWTRLFSDQRLSPGISLPRLEPSVLFSTTLFFEELYRETAFRSTLTGQGHFTALMKRLRENRLTDLILTNPVRAKVGSHLRLVICAGAPAPEKVVEFFAAAGVTLLMGYGSTETCGSVALNTPDDFKLGSAGRPLPEVSAQIAADGEILIKSEKIFAGYYRMPEETQAAIRAGWFHTGDTGFLDAEGFLFITERKRDLLQLKSGRKVSPSRFERLARLNPYFLDLFVFGEGREHLTALVTLEKRQILEFAEKNGVLFTQYDDLLRNPKILSLVQAGIEEINTQAATPDRIRRFMVVSRPFSEETGDLSRSRRVRRPSIEKRFKTELESLYLDSPETFRY